MDHRDKELLEKQLRVVTEPRHDGTLLLMLIVVFAVGLGIGTFFFNKADITRTLSGSVSALVQPGTAPAPRG
jgi:hypothetical protein